MKKTSNGQRRMKGEAVRARHGEFVRLANKGRSDERKALVGSRRGG